MHSYNKLPNSGINNATGISAVKRASGNDNSNFNVGSHSNEHACDGLHEAFGFLPVLTLVHTLLSHLNSKLPS